MRILVPLNNRENIKTMHAAGADEIYLGFYDENWTKRFGEYSDINRMSGFYKNANQYSFIELLSVIGDIRAKNMCAFVTMNANAYSEDMLEWIQKKYFSALLEVGVSGVIASTEGIARKAVEVGLQVVGSTIMGLYNTDIIDYYYSLGIKRMIVPRDLTLAEIALIRERFPDIVLEVFFMRRGCVFSDAYCLGAHRKECGSLCGNLKTLNKIFIYDTSRFPRRDVIELNDSIYNRDFHKEACGMCSLYRMKKIGVDVLKIVGRADSPEAVIEDINLTRENLEILQTCNSEEEYLKKMLLPKNSKNLCRDGLSCYYPEVRFG